MVFCIMSKTGCGVDSFGCALSAPSSSELFTLVFNDENNVEIIFNRKLVRTLFESLNWKWTKILMKTKPFNVRIQSIKLLTAWLCTRDCNSEKQGDTTISNQRRTSSGDSMLINLPMLYIKRTSSELIRWPLLMACKHAWSNGSAYAFKCTWHSRHKSFNPSDACAVWFEFNPTTKTRIACGI